MNTKGGCQTYSHPLVTYLNPAREVSAGWYTWFRDAVPFESWADHLYPHRVPTETLHNLDSSFSVQTLWLTNYYKSLD